MQVKPPQLYVTVIVGNVLRIPTMALKSPYSMQIYFAKIIKELYGRMSTEWNLPNVLSLTTYKCQMDKLLS